MIDPFARYPHLFRPRTESPEDKAYREAVMAFLDQDVDRNGYLGPKERPRDFKALDRNADGRVTLDEYVRPTDKPTSLTVPIQPKPVREPVGTYTTAYSHRASELADQLGFGSVAALYAANPTLEATFATGVIPAGTAISAPASNRAVLAAMARLSDENGGGRYQAPGDKAQTPTPKPSPPGRATLGDPNSYYMKQVFDPRWNPQGPTRSSNCGPASLAMALRAFGLAPPNAPNPTTNVEGFIDATRMAMTGNTNDHVGTNTGDVIRGARASGATAEAIGFGGLDQALAAGKLVVAAGNPAAYNGDWADRGLANSEYDGGHFILVTGKDAAGNYRINDPLSNVGSVTVTRAQLQRYFGYQGWNAGVAIGR